MRLENVFVSSVPAIKVPVQVFVFTDTLADLQVGGIASIVGKKRIYEITQAGIRSNELRVTNL